MSVSSALSDLIIIYVHIDIFINFTTLTSHVVYIIFLFFVLLFLDK